MREVYADQLRRVRMMAEGNPTWWDLSDNDIDALKAVLEQLDSCGMEVAILQARETDAAKLANQLIEPELRKDKVRLDWLDKSLKSDDWPAIGVEVDAGSILSVTACQWASDCMVVGSTIREAIDAAMEAK